MSKTETPPTPAPSAPGALADPDAQDLEIERLLDLVFEAHGEAVLLSEPPGCSPAEAKAAQGKLGAARRALLDFIGRSRTAMMSDTIAALSSARREANTLRRERDALMVELNRKADEARAFWGERDEARAALSAERAAREAAERDPAALKERVGEACRRVWDSARTSDDTPSGCYLVDSGPMLDLHGLMLACRASAPTPPARTEERHDG